MKPKVREALLYFVPEMIEVLCCLCSVKFLCIVYDDGDFVTLQMREMCLKIESENVRDRAS